MSVLISVAHSSAAQGAVNSQQTLTEYRVSLRASETCWRTLSGSCAAELYDCGPLMPKDYDDAKVSKVNHCAPELAIEIHCNASTDERAQYGEVIYANQNSPAKAVAGLICNSLADGFAGGRHGHWPMHGPRADDRDLFFLQRTQVPCLIVEGLFISNDEQANWLSTGGAETYGVLVANAIKAWLGVK